MMLNNGHTDDQIPRRTPVRNLEVVSLGLGVFLSVCAYLVPKAPFYFTCCQVLDSERKYDYKFVSANGGFCAAPSVSL